MEVSWSQNETPSKVWWALEASGLSSTSLTADVSELKSPASPTRSLGDSLRLEQSSIFYNYVDETDYMEGEEELSGWLREERTRGVIRVFQPGTSFSELIKCDLDTTTETVIAKCLAKELYVCYGSKRVRKVGLTEHPLQIQLRFFQELGHSSPARMQLEGLKEDLPFLFKFVAGQEKGNRPEDKVQLACPLKVKEQHGVMTVWNKRFCVLCGSRMFIFATSHPRGKPTLVLGLRGARVEENKTKKYPFCLKITTSRAAVVLLAFESRLEQGRWLERAGKIISKHPLEADLAGYSLERVPKYYFLNYNIIALNLAHNFMIESFEQTDASFLGYPKTIGWIDDIPIFRRLVSLSLSENQLDQFPQSICSIVSLRELDISCNSIKRLPQEIEKLTNLTTLLLHSNQLTALPSELNELKQLSTLVIAFNRFFQLPNVLPQLPALRIFIASGNYISALPEGMDKLVALQHFDIRFNKVKPSLPHSMVGMRNLTRMNVRGNGISELNMAALLYLEFLNCSDNGLRSLVLNEGPVKDVIAKNNSITQFSVPPTCDQLTSINLSKNELTSLPESLVDLENLVNFNASNNKLTKLPTRIFQMAKLSSLRVYNNRLVKLPQEVSPNCPLKVLDLHCNQLTSLPSNLLAECYQLEVINVSSNRLTSLPHTAPSRKPHQLQEFYAASNALKDSCFTVLTSYRKLVILHLAYNGLRVMPTGFFTAMKSLDYLNLSGNSFSSLPPILGCPRLRCLILHSNQIQSLPQLPLLSLLHTLDLSCNQFESVPKISSFPHLKILDLSGNSSLVVTEESVRNIRSSDVTRCCLEGILDMDAALTKSDTFETGGTTIHGRWSYGSGVIIGTKNSVDCTAHVKVASLDHRPDDGLFAVMDGGRSPEASTAISGVLAETLTDELAEEERERGEGDHNVDHLQYLTYTFLTVHRKLGEIGQQYGSSAVLSHIHMLPNGSYVLNVANTGLGEAILCRSGRGVPLTTPHVPATNFNERTRIADTRGFVSQDNRVNGVCGASRLIGVYHLWPQIIPIPSTESVELRTEDEHIVVATNSLWKHVTYDQVVHEVKSVSDPIQAAKRLRDLAVAHGCSMDVSVTVIKLKMDREPSVRSMTSLQPVQVVSGPDSDLEAGEEEDDDPGVTNIDDPMSDEEEEEMRSESRGVLLPMDSNTQDTIDRLVMGAISSALGSKERETEEDQPMMHSTNFDDLPPLTDESPEPPTPLGTDSTPSDLPHQVASSESRGQQVSGPLSYKQQQVQQQMEMDYEAQTLPKIASQARKSGGFTHLETSFEQTQSVPTLQLKWTLQNPQAQGLSDPVSDQLLTLNAALTRLEEETGYSPGTYHMESIERPRKRGGRVVGNRLSYVEHSYQQLTNDTYSSNSSSVHPVKAVTNLDSSH